MAIQAIARDIPVTNEQFSHLQSAFLIAYAFMYAGGGKLMDVLGTRRGFTVIMLFWSLACASHGLAASVCYARPQPVPARRRRRRRLPRRHAGRGGVVPGAGALHRHGHHQRGHRRRDGRGAAADRPGPGGSRTGAGSSSSPAPSAWSGRSGGTATTSRPTATRGSPTPSARAPIGARRGVPARRQGLPLDPAAALPPDLGPRDRQVPERCRVVLLSLLAAEVPL